VVSVDQCCEQPWNLQRAPQPASVYGTTISLAAHQNRLGVYGTTISHHVVAVAHVAIVHLLLI
jgi:hypothetical protein